MEIKNKSNTKISKFTLQTYAFVYQRLINFPRGKFGCETVTTINFFSKTAIESLMSKYIYIIHILRVQLLVTHMTSVI